MAAPKRNKGSMTQRLKNLPACRRRGFDPWVGKVLWSRKWQPTPVFFPGKPMDRRAWWATVHGVTKELDMA